MAGRLERLVAKIAATTPAPVARLAAPSCCMCRGAAGPGALHRTVAATRLAVCAACAPAAKKSARCQQ